GIISIYTVLVQLEVKSGGKILGNASVKIAVVDDYNSVVFSAVSLRDLALEGAIVYGQGARCSIVIHERNEHGVSGLIGRDNLSFRPADCRLCAGNTDAVASGDHTIADIKGVVAACNALVI